MNIEEKLKVENLRKFYLFDRDILNIHPNITFGLEIEFQNVLLSLLMKNFKDDFWKFIPEEDTITKPYGEFGYLGGEAITTICHDSKQDWQQIRNLLQFIKAAGGYVDHYCGGHIHIGKNILEGNSLYFNRFFKLWIAYEDIIYRFGNHSETGRKGQSFYAKPISNKLYYFLEKYHFQPDYQHIMNFSKNFKHYGLSLTDLPRIYGTFEFRSPDATLDIELWQNHVLFFSKLLEASTNDYIDFDVVDRRLYDFNPNNAKLELYQNMNFHKAEELSNLIYDNSVDKTCFLKEYTKKGPLVKVA